MKRFPWFRGAQHNRTIRILQIDADQRQSATLRTALPWRYHLTRVATFQEAVTLLHEDATFDLIITELDLPDNAGNTVVSTICALPTTRHAIVIVTTYRANVTDKVNAFQAGADDYLVKPIDPQSYLAHFSRAEQLRTVLKR